jgi:hypothetical protein
MGFESQETQVLEVNEMFCCLVAQLWPQNSCDKFAKCHQYFSQRKIKKIFLLGTVAHACNPSYSAD